jgi:Icc-related predicted phosphoesterase
MRGVNATSLARALEIGQNTFAMKILAVSDQVENRLHSPLLREAYGDVKLLIGCGDLPYEYLEYMISSLDVPLLYVPGNHDPAYDPSHPMARVDGGTNIDRRVVTVKGLTIAGLGGSIRYRPKAANQYSQSGMYFQALPLFLRLGWRRLRATAALDILVTHSPPKGVHDDADPAHTGLQAINLLTSVLRPRYLLHGHTHNYRGNLLKSRTQVGATLVINVFPYTALEI